MDVTPHLVLKPADIDALVAQPHPELGVGVSGRVLWRSGPSQAGVMQIEPDGQLERHTHRAAHHHMWILAGECRVLDQVAGAGSYVHIPAGVEHGMECVGTTPCRFLYLYVRES
jgi:quercetin dioxygenase-like cupin family protein